VITIWLMLTGAVLVWLLVNGAMFWVGMDTGRLRERRRILDHLDGCSNTVPPYTLAEFRPRVDCNDPYRPPPPPKICDKCGHPDWAHSPCSPMGCTQCDCQETSV
jgi:hypothetical protein